MATVLTCSAAESHLANVIARLLRALRSGIIRDKAPSLLILYCWHLSVKASVKPEVAETQLSIDYCVQSIRANL